jgi:hypothetical protein
MQHLECPRCRASFEARSIQQRLERCPRCGASFGPPRPTFTERVRRVLKQHAAGDAPDWETITGSQYAARGKTARRRDRGPGRARVK